MKKVHFYMESSRDFKTDEVLSFEADYTDEELEYECDEWARKHAVWNNTERYKFWWETEKTI